MIFSSSHWRFEKSTLWALNQTWCYLEGGGVGAIYLIWLANPGLLRLTTEAQQGRTPFSPASTGAGRPILGEFAPLHGCPFIFIRTKPHSEWSSKRLALLSRAFWLYGRCTLRTLWQKLMEDRLSQPGYSMAEPATFLPQQVLQPWNADTRAVWTEKPSNSGIS